jgi:hypothetical protein
MKSGFPGGLAQLAQLFGNDEVLLRTMRHVTEATPDADLWNGSGKLEINRR